MLSNKKRKIDHVQQATQYNNSVVKIESTDLSTSYETPWKGAKQVKYDGSGSVIDAENGLILTCAHVSNPRNLTMVRLGSEEKKYRGKVVVCEMDCDMAIIQVDDPEFRKKAKAVSFGNYTFQPIGSHVVVVGYPMQTKELTATAGQVSNNEVQTYVAGDAKNLVSMVSAAINPGNSGGPAFSESGEQIGVVFQGDDPGEVESAGFIIPAPVVKRFMDMAMAAIAKQQPTPGIPALPLSIQYMQNPALRQFYGMRQDHSGVRIKKIDTLAKDLGLKEDDIILAIDGHRIQNDGTFSDYKQISERLFFTYLISQKYIGDSVKIKVLRDRQEVTVDYQLKYRSNDLKLINRLEVKREPTFYIKNGVAFQPVTPNYLTTERGQGLLLVQDRAGALINAAKKTPDEQLIVINTVFDADCTEGYGEIGGVELVDKVNGVEIKNMRDLVFAMESQKSGLLEIDLKSKGKIVMNTNNPEEEATIKSMHDIPKTHSDDLIPFVQTANAMQNGSGSLVSNQYMQQQQQPQQHPQQQKKKVTI